MAQFSYGRPLSQIRKWEVKIFLRIEVQVQKFNKKKTYETSTKNLAVIKKVIINLNALSATLNDENIFSGLKSSTLKLLSALLICSTRSQFSQWTLCSIKVIPNMDLFSAMDKFFFFSFGRYVPSLIFYTIKC